MSQDLDTLNMSFDFYRSLVRRSVDYYTFNFNDSTLAAAAKQMSKHLRQRLVATMLRDYDILLASFKEQKKSRKKSAIEIDWSKYICYFDLLDSVIEESCSQEEWQNNRDYLRSKCSNYDFAHCAAMELSFSKLIKLARMILLQTFNGTATIQQSSDSLANAAILPGDELAYYHLFANTEAEIANDYVKSL
ncbi:MAG: hypothetical protein HOA17_00340 [Candidatus Melainabacteria bacterium]|jgi:hypothetical protein|nr:hypothetical protein [Candidatus Melainabacteria bacterium]